MPADGIVKEGESAVDEAMITGESRPVKKHEGDEAIAATINGEGSLRIEVTGTGDKTKLFGIMRLVADAQTSKSRAQHLADRAAQLLTVAAIPAPPHAARRLHEMEAAAELLAELGVDPVMTRSTVAHLALLADGSAAPPDLPD